jgi:hypothetical protein
VKQDFENKISTDAETIRHKNGRVVTEKGEPTGKQGDGQFLKRGTCVNI